MSISADGLASPSPTIYGLIMALEIRQNLKLTQTLIMTQKLQQAIKLLQLSRMELVGEIQQALETNPVLEETQSEDQGPEVVEEESWTPKIESTAPETESKGDGEAQGPLDEWDWMSFLRDQEAPISRGEYEVRESPPFENLNAQKTTLKAHLTWQLQMMELDQEAERIGNLIIGNLDPHGYLQASAEEIAQEVGVEPARVEEVLQVIQGDRLSSDQCCAHCLADRAMKGKILLHEFDSDNR